MRPLVAAILVIFTAGLAEGEIQTRSVEYKEGDTVLEGYLAYDDSVKGKSPGVLIVHNWTGLDDYEKMRARMLAEMGYVAFAADIYGKGVKLSNPGEYSQQASKYRGDRALYRKRVNAGLDTLKKQEMVDPSKTAAIGYCFGGTGVLELARSGADVGGVVSFHGGLSNPNPEDAKNIKCKVLVLHGGDDPHVPPEEVAAFLEEMQPVDIQWDFHAYGNAVHAFTEKEAGDDPSRGAAYDARADRESWAAMQRFFQDLFHEGAHSEGSHPKSMGAGVSAATVPTSPEDTHPLGVGASVPDVAVRTLDGESVSLREKIAEKPTVLIFYRGGWCPYCNTHLAKLQQIEPKLVELGYQVLAVSPDRPEKLKETLDKNNLNYALLSDSSMAAARDFGLAFRVSNETVEKYKEYSIDLVDASGESHHLLPVPAAYVVDTDGVIHFAYTNPDYRTRIEPKALLAAAEEAAKE